MGLVKDLPAPSIQLLLPAGFLHTATLEEGSRLRGQDWDGDEIWFSFNSSPCSLLLLTLFAACVRREKKVQNLWYC